MRIHILGICGTFMGSLAVLARELGHDVSGSDANVYPPMSTQLQTQGIELKQGFSAANLQPHPELVVIGNAMSRGNPAVEYVLDNNLPYCSGPEFLSRWVLQDRWVLGVAGTHGKTTTSSMLAWILQDNGLNPGYLIGGVATNFPASAALGQPPFFVVEADEYDTAFFDKRSKFVHYRPRTTILNNLEFDHGDIFADLSAIQTQFHHLVRIIPANGLVLHATGETHVEEVLEQGCWTPVQQYGIDLDETTCAHLVQKQGVFWHARLADSQGSSFTVEKHSVDGDTVNQATAQVSWEMTGLHNVKNALAAIAAAHHAGVSFAAACQSLCQFSGVKRRMELRGEVAGIRVYDDFAHHPTAIASTLEGIAAKVAKATTEGRVIAVIEPRSNTMRMGIHQGQLANSTAAANLVIWKQPEEAGLDLDQVVKESSSPGKVLPSVQAIIDLLAQSCAPGDHIVIMSNGGFEGIHERLLGKLQESRE